MIAAQLGKCSINVDVVSEPNDEGGGSVGKAILVEGYPAIHEIPIFGRESG